MKKNTFVFALILLLAIALSGCATYYPASPKPVFVNMAKSKPLIILNKDDLPEKSYIILEQVSITQRGNVTASIILQELQLKAQRIGANAIINIDIDKFQREEYPVINMLVDLSDSDCRCNEPTTVIRSYKTISATAIKYIDDLKYKPSLLHKQQYFIYQESDSLMITQENYNIRQQSVKEVFDVHSDVMSVYQTLVKPYDHYTLTRERKNWKFTSYSNGTVGKRKLYALNGDLLVKECKFKYKGSLYPESILINYFDLGLVSHSENIDIRYNSKNKIVSRIINRISRENKEIREEWNYNSDGRLEYIQYFKADNKKPFAVFYQQYYSEETWKDEIAKITVNP